MHYRNSFSKHFNIPCSKDVFSGKLESSYYPNNIDADSFVPDFGYSELNLNGLLYYPIYDMQKIDEGKPRPFWPENKSFAVCLTHDLDIVSAKNISQVKRIIKRCLNFKIGYKENIKLFFIHLFEILKLVGKKDPYQCIYDWINFEYHNSVRSTFFIPSDRINKVHFTDCLYTLKDCISYNGETRRIISILKEIFQDGWEIGLHPSWYSFNDNKEMKLQKESLENALENEIVSVRQHYLHFDVHITPIIHSNAGFLYDSTLGFNRNIGFRFGTCYPFFFDGEILDKMKNNKIMEIPMIIQDTSLLGERSGLQLDEKVAMKYITKITERVKQVGGVLTLSWHTNNHHKASWWNIYKDIVTYLKEQNAWFCTVKEVGKWWTKTNMEN